MVKLSNEQIEECYNRLLTFKPNGLKELINEQILKHWTKPELVDFIRVNFCIEDYEWFYEEYIKDDGEQK